MSDQLHPVWQQVEQLLQDGVNLVPVRDRDEVINGEVFNKKTPYAKWKQYQTQFIDRQELFHQMEQRNTTAVAIVCGTISGNLEGIDIDTKYQPGADVRFFTDLQTLYPDLLAKLRVHKTPSGGCHIPYRIAPGHAVPPSQPLAKRPATEAELLAEPKKKYRCFIETRGQGALMGCPPSMGYTVRRDLPIPTLTWEERCTLIELAKSYNTYIKPPEVYKPNRAEVDYYDENPFEHYNRTVDPVELFTACGWAFVANRGGYIWFTRPGGKKGDVHASFNAQARYFYIFTVNSDLESERAYNPATILAHYNFEGNKQRTYQWLVQAGYGRIKPQVEQRIIQNKALTGQPLPANISPQARELHTQVVAQLNTTHPHGVFWAPDTEGHMHISRLRWRTVVEGLGFRLYNGEPVQVIDNFIYRRDERYVFDTLRAYINEPDADLYQEIYDSHQSFLQKNGKFEISQLQKLPIDSILQDTRNICYKYYTNGYVQITAQGYDLLPYASLGEQLIWAEKLQPRDFMVSTTNGVYTDFLEKAIELSKHKQHIMRCIGYLAHDWKDETTGYIIVLTEQCPDPRQGGGTGKNLLCNLFNLTTTYTSIPGSQAQFNEKFLQSWNGQRIFGISDVEEKFPYAFLKDMATGSALVKKLFKNDQTFTVADLPKFVLQTNFSFDISDGGLKRRIIYIEFTNFFTENKGVKKYYGKHFWNDWAAEDFIAYDNFICESVREWLAKECELTNITMSDTGWEKQFIYNFNEDLFEFMNEYGDLFIRKEFLFNSEVKKMYDDFMAIRSNGNYKVSPRKLNNAIEFYFLKNGYKVQRDILKRNQFTDKPEKGILVHTIDPPFI